MEGWRKGGRCPTFKDRKRNFHLKKKFLNTPFSGRKGRTVQREKSESIQPKSAGRRFTVQLKYGGSSSKGRAHGESCGPRSPNPAGRKLGCLRDLRCTDRYAGGRAVEKESEKTSKTNKGSKRQSHRTRRIRKEGHPERKPGRNRLPLIKRGQGEIAGARSKRTAARRG